MSTVLSSGIPALLIKTSMNPLSSLASTNALKNCSVLVTSHLENFTLSSPYFSFNDAWRDSPDFSSTSRIRICCNETWMVDEHQLTKIIYVINNYTYFVLIIFTACSQTNEKNFYDYICTQIILLYLCRIKLKIEKKALRNILLLMILGTFIRLMTIFCLATNIMIFPCISQPHTVLKTFWNVVL